MDMKRILNRVMFVLGWLLSPFTLWNDAIINIPLAYLSANIVVRFFPTDFAFTVVVFYWLSNILGIAIMYAAGRPIMRNREDLPREIFIFLTTIIVYSVVILILGRAGIMRPVIYVND